MWKVKLLLVDVDFTGVFDESRDLMFQPGLYHM